MIRKSLLLFTLLLNILVSCNEEKEEGSGEQNTTPAPTMVKAPDFNADSAYAFIEKQVAFGPRVAGTPAHKKCGAFLIETVKKITDTVYIQQTTVTQPISNKKYPCTNIIGSINPGATQRILLLAHWDTRAWADEDSKDPQKPIDGADDGGSGVGVLLEVAQKIKQQPISNLGVDFLLVDVEDLGKSEWTGDSYCLGSQYWARNKHIPNYTAKFGVCLDMVGAKGATFPMEAISKNYAPAVQREIWDLGNSLGYSSYFLYNAVGSIDDDHLPVNEIAKIPCVDIIHLKNYGGFGDHWHTHQDNMSVIDKATLKAVGQTVIQMIYNQQ